ncbi:MAG: class I SAM-dependent methyltransferase [Candidatus Coatesbacteria bacterium]|nr:class I SAM-dependent methyltransferase [Candidatus Coatesbacteria bacterium]
MSTYDFDLVADRYDDWYDNPVGRMYDRIQKKAIDRALPIVAADGLMLEIGCGTGQWTEYFTSSGIRVVGVDISRQMLQVAGSKGIPSARFVRADAIHLPFKDGSFELISAITSLEFVGDARAVVLEAARCAKYGGWMVIGMLNRASLMAWLRKRRRSPLFAGARLMSVDELGNLLDTIGVAKVYSTAFMLPWRGLLWFSVVLNAVGRLFRLPFGDFMVGVLKIQFPIEGDNER